MQSCLASDRLKMKRRRFSQTRPRSTVSFEEPLENVAPSTPVPVVADSMPKFMMSESVTSVSASVNDIVSCSEGNPSNSASDSTPAQRLPMTSEGLPSAMSAGLSGVQLSVTPCTPTYSDRLVNVLVSGASGTGSTCCNLSVECKLSYCTVDKCLPICSVFTSQSSSQYSEWSASKSSASTSSESPASVPLSCYNSKEHRGNARYALSSLDTRSIFTHSSYWQYKNKMRVMQSMPTQPQVPAVSVAESTSSQAMSDVTDTSCTAAVFMATSPLPALAPPFVVHSDDVSKKEVISPTIVVSNSCRPSVITRDVPMKKKFLHRSQSTPNAREQTQSKVRWVRRSN